VSLKGFVGRLNDIFAEVVLADHDKGLQTVTETAQKAVLLAGELFRCF
jgi:hypothetical protein